MRPPAARILIVALTALLAACVSWRAEPRETGLQRIQQRPQAVRAKLNNGTVVTYRMPLVRGDSVFEGDRAFGSGRTVAITDIASFETRDVHEGASALTILGIVFGLAIFAFAVTWGGVI